MLPTVEEQYNQPAQLRLLMTGSDGFDAVGYVLVLPIGPCRNGKIRRGGRYRQRGNPLLKQHAAAGLQAGALGAALAVLALSLGPDHDG